MNKRKIDNWVIFCLKMLPFLLLVIFSIFIHRHDIPEEITYEVTIPFQPFEKGFKYVEGETSFSINNVANPEVDSYAYRFVAVADSYEFIINWLSEEQTFFVEGLMAGEYFGFNTKYVSSESLFNATYDGRVQEVETNINADRLLGFPSYTQINSINNSFEIIAYEFNSYLENFYQFNVFNINDFYNWTIKSLFDGVPPLYYKSVFSLLVYELIIDLLILMYSFITFVIKFAQKWLNGIYNKDW